MNTIEKPLANSLHLKFEDKSKNIAELVIFMNNTDFYENK